MASSTSLRQIFRLVSEWIMFVLNFPPAWQAARLLLAPACPSAWLSARLPASLHTHRSTRIAWCLMCVQAKMLVPAVAWLLGCGLGSRSLLQLVCVTMRTDPARTVGPGTSISGMGVHWSSTDRRIPIQRHAIYSADRRPVGEHKQCDISVRTTSFLFAMRGTAASNSSIKQEPIIHLFLDS